MGIPRPPHAPKGLHGDHTLADSASMSHPSEAATEITRSTSANSDLDSAMTPAQPAQAVVAGADGGGAGSTQSVPRRPVVPPLRLESRFSTTDDSPSRSNRSVTVDSLRSSETAALHGAHRLSLGSMYSTEGPECVFYEAGIPVLRSPRRRSAVTDPGAHTDRGPRRKASDTAGYQRPAVTPRTYTPRGTAIPISARRAAAGGLTPQDSSHRKASGVAATSRRPAGPRLGVSPRVVSPRKGGTPRDNPPWGVGTPRGTATPRDTNTPRGGRSPTKRTVTAAATARGVRNGAGMPRDRPTPRGAVLRGAETPRMRTTRKGDAPVQDSQRPESGSHTQLGTTTRRQRVTPRDGVTSPAERPVAEGRPAAPRSATPPHVRLTPRQVAVRRGVEMPRSATPPRGMRTKFPAAAIAERPRRGSHEEPCNRHTGIASVTCARSPLMQDVYSALWHNVLSDCHAAGKEVLARTMQCRIVMPVCSIRVFLSFTVCAAGERAVRSFKHPHRLSYQEHLDGPLGTNLARCDSASNALSAVSEPLPTCLAHESAQAAARARASASAALSAAASTDDDSVSDTLMRASSQDILRSQRSAGASALPRAPRGGSASPAMSTASEAPTPFGLPLQQVPEEEEDPRDAEHSEAGTARAGTWRQSRLPVPNLAIPPPILDGRPQSAHAAVRDSGGTGGPSDSVFAWGSPDAEMRSPATRPNVARRALKSASDVCRRLAEAATVSSSRRSRSRNADPYDVTNAALTGRSAMSPVHNVSVASGGSRFRTPSPATSHGSGATFRTEPGRRPSPFVAGGTGISHRAATVRSSSPRRARSRGSAARNGIDGAGQLNSPLRRTQSGIAGDAPAASLEERLMQRGFTSPWMASDSRNGRMRSPGGPRNVRTPIPTSDSRAPATACID